MAALTALTALIARFCASVPHGDKVLHFGGGTIMGAAFPLAVPDWWAVGAASAIAGGKEVYDGRNPARHTRDGWDFFWTLMGIALGFAGQKLVKAQEGPWQALQALFV
jgi:hypothetical protein